MESEWERDEEGIGKGRGGRAKRGGKGTKGEKEGKEGDLDSGG